MPSGAGPADAAPAARRRRCGLLAAAGPHPAELQDAAAGPRTAVLHTLRTPTLHEFPDRCAGCRCWSRRAARQQPLLRLRAGWARVRPHAVLGKAQHSAGWAPRAQLLQLPADTRPCGACGQSELRTSLCQHPPTPAPVLTRWQSGCAHGAVIIPSDLQDLPGSQARQVPRWVLCIHAAALSLQMQLRGSNDKLGRKPSSASS